MGEVMTGEGVRQNQERPYRTVGSRPEHLLYHWFGDSDDGDLRLWTPHGFVTPSASMRCFEKFVPPSPDHGDALTAAGGHQRPRRSSAARRDRTAQTGARSAER